MEARPGGMHHTARPILTCPASQADPKHGAREPCRRSGQAIDVMQALSSVPTTAASASSASSFWNCVFWFNANTTPNPGASSQPGSGRNPDRVVFEAATGAQRVTAMAP